MNIPVKPGFERHHRQKGDRENWDATNILYLTPEDHRWAEDHPDEARELGWSVSRYENPAEVPVTIPRAIHKEKKERAPRKARDRAVVALRVPKDEQEDGAGILDDLVEQARERLAEHMGWDEKVPPYFVLTAVLYDWLS